MGHTHKLSNPPPADGKNQPPRPSFETAASQPPQHEVRGELPGTHNPHGEERGEAPRLEPWAADTFPEIPCGRKSGVRDDDLAVFDPDQIDARSALTAFLAGRTALLEL